MIIKKPSIFIYAHHADPLILKEVSAGIEEEGVFFEIFDISNASVENLAAQAAQDSMLGSGIGILKADICLKMRGLESRKNIERYSNPTKNQCRNLGSNSARIIKKLSLKEEYSGDIE